MDKEFIPYEQALALKELRFDEPCLAFYNHQSILIMMAQENEEEVSTWKNSYVPLGKQYAAPTFSQAFRWFREKYGLKHDIDDDNVGTKFYYKIRSYTDKFDNYDDIIKPMREEKDWAKIEFKTYEEADLACLIKLIEIVKNK